MVVVVVAVVAAAAAAGVAVGAAAAAGVAVEQLPPLLLPVLVLAREVEAAQIVDVSKQAVPVGLGAAKR
jgi:hypothetical protein